MIWLEVSRDVIHGDITGLGSWSFGKCLWSPTSKTNREKSGFWEPLQDVQAGDVIFHVRWIQRQPAIVGFSSADTDGIIERIERPPNPGKWAYARSFYRVILKDYVDFPKPLFLRDIFSRYKSALVEYLEISKSKPKKQRSPLFYTVAKKGAMKGKLRVNQGLTLRHSTKSYLTSCWDQLRCQALSQMGMPFNMYRKRQHKLVSV
jgi:hypothetical protein